MKTLKKIQAATISWNNLEGQKLHYKTFHTGHEEGMRREEKKTKKTFETESFVRFFYILLLVGTV